MKFGLRVKAAVAAVSSIYGSAVNVLARPLRRAGGLLGDVFPGSWQMGFRPDGVGELTSFGAVYACITRIANDIAKLEPRLMQLGDHDIWALADRNSPRWKILRKPNGFQNRIQFFAYWLTCKLIHGNTYALKVREGRDMVIKLYLLDPRKVHPLVTPQGDVYYSLAGDDLARIPAGMVVPASEIIHDRMNCLWHPLVGISPLVACALSATQGIRIQQNSGKFFENMSRPSGMLTAPGSIDEATAKRLKTEFEANFSGQNIGRLAVAGDGLDYTQMTIPAETAQLIEQLAWTVEDVARAFDMPLYKIGAGAMPTNNNVEALNQQYYDGCLQPHIESLELCLDEGQDTPADQRTEFDLDGLLRMDQVAQMTTLAEGVKGILKINEARRRLNLPPVTGGDTVYLQQQNYSLEALDKRDRGPDPFSAAKPPAPAAPAEPAEPAEPSKQFDVLAFVKALDEAALVTA